MPDDADEGDDDVNDPASVEPLPGAPPTTGLLPQLTDELAGLRQRVEVVQQDVAGLVARLHTLSNAVAGVETALGERIAEYEDTVVQLGRGLTANVSTYREGNERSVAELRGALADTEELLRAVLTKADDLSVGLAAVRTDLTADSAGDTLDAVELRAIVSEAVEAVDVRADVRRLAADVGALGDRMSTELAAASTVPPPTSAASPLDTAMHAELLTALEAMRGELEAVRRSATRPSKAATSADHERALVTELEALREEITQLKRRIAVRAKSSAIDDEQIAAIAEAVAQRFGEAFEVVTEE